MAQKKRGKKKRIALTLIFIVIFLSIFYFSYKILILGENNKNPVTKINNQQQSPQNEKDSQNAGNSGSTSENVNSNINSGLSTSPSEGGSGSGSSGGGSSGGGASSQNCAFKQISYSITNLNKTSICNQYQNNICIDKTVTCSSTIKNLEDNAGGFFQVKLIFLEEGKTQENALDSKISGFSLNPLESYFFEGSTNIQSSGINGTANKNINCFFNTLEVPTKEVC